MKIRITATLDIPAAGIEAWMLEYGVARHEVPEDVRTYIRTQLQECTGAHVAEWQVDGPRPTADEGNCAACGGRVMWGDCAQGCHAARAR